MSGNFSFPPPPPPPPKANPAQTNQYESQGRGQGRGRGGFRGGQNDRARGGSQGGQHGRGSPHSNGRGQYHGSSNGQQPSFPEHRGSQPGFQQQNRDASSQFNGNAGSPPRTIAGHKRKLEALRPPQREMKPAPQTAPAIPSFGASLPLPSKPPGVSSTVKAYAEQGDAVQSNQQSKNRGKSLGLIPTLADPQASSSDSEDDDQEVDEEATFAELGDKLTFEHNGVVMSLNSQADLNAWKKERQKNWPTKVRMAERAEERRKIGEERKRLLAGNEALMRSSKDGSVKSRTNRGHGGSKRVDAKTGTRVRNDETMSPKQPGTGIGKAKKELDEQARRLDELRRKVKESEAKNRRAKAQQDPASGSVITKSFAVDTSPNGSPNLRRDMEDSAQQDDNLEESDADSEESSLLESSSVLSSDSADDDDSSSDYGPPEEITSKLTKTAIQGVGQGDDALSLRHEQRPSIRSVPINNTTESHRPSRRNNADGPPRLEQRTTRKSIYDRLVEQEQLEEDRLALKVIKYLGKAGFFNESGNVDEE